MGSEVCGSYEADWNLGGQASRTFDLHWCSLELLERSGNFILALGIVSLVRRRRIVDSLSMNSFRMAT